MSTLSVIIPVYNVERYLEQCLSSIILQTYRDIEIICINDGSTDNSLKILESYAAKDKRIRIINQENKGQSAARNAGLHVATGEYVTFVDSDDYLDTNAYELALSDIKKADIVCFGAKVFGNKNTKQKISDDKYYKVKFCGFCELNDNIRLETDCSVCNKIFKRDVINKYKIQFPVGIHFEDAEFYFKYINIAKTAYFIPQYFYHYRRRANSIMDQLFNGCDYAIEHLYIVEHLYKFLVENNLWKLREGLFVDIFIAYFYYAYNRTPEDKKAEVLLLGKEYANTFNISKKYLAGTISNLKKGIFGGLSKSRFTFLERIFSFKNDIRGIHKIITVCGISIKIRRKKKVVPKVSVIIPVYNTEKYLRECLDSVINQTLKDIEIICINDGSTDDSIKILNEYAQKDKRIKVISYKKNRGGGYARNQGLKIASGEYLAFLDSDDTMNSNILEKIYTKCKEFHTDIGVCGGDYYDVLTKEQHKMPWALRMELLPQQDVFSAVDIYDCIFNFSQNWNSNKLFNRNFISRNKIKFQNIYRTNDLLFTCKALSLANRITTLNESLFIYRINHGTSCQQNNYLYPLDFYKAFKELKKWLVRKKLYNKVRKSYTEWALAGCVYNINSIRNHDDVKNLVRKKVFTRGIKEFNLKNHNECVVIEADFHKEFDYMLEEFNKQQQIEKQPLKDILFSIKTSVNTQHKVITILGIKIKLRRKH